MHNRRQFLKLTFKTAVVISAGNVLQSFTASKFTFPPKSDISLRFAIASDGHYGQEGTEYVALHDEMVAWINAEQKARGIDFTVINGDLFHDNNAMLPLVEQQWDKLEMPYHVSHGNHDKINEAAWEETFNSQWHYSFQKDDTAFIVLNTADETGKYICPDIDWTKSTLAKYETKSKLFVFMHITPVKWTNAGIACPEITDIFSKQKNLKAIFHGHDHDQDDVKENGGKYYFFDSHVAGSWGTDYHGYRIVEVLKSGEVITYQMNPSTQQQVNSNKIL